MKQFEQSAPRDFDEILARNIVFTVKKMPEDSAVRIIVALLRSVRNYGGYESAIALYNKISAADPPKPSSWGDLA